MSRRSLAVLSLICVTFLGACGVSKPESTILFPQKGLAESEIAPGEYALVEVELIERRSSVDKSSEQSLHLRHVLAAAGQADTSDSVSVTRLQTRGEAELNCGIRVPLKLTMGQSLIQTGNTYLRYTADALGAAGARTTVFSVRDANRPSIQKKDLQSKQGRYSAKEEKAEGTYEANHAFQQQGDTLYVYVSYRTPSVQGSDATYQIARLGYQKVQ